MKIPLSKPLTIGDGDAKRTLEALDLGLDALTGADVQVCVRDASESKGEMVRVLVMDLDFHIHLAAKASGVSVADLRKLGAADFVEVATAVQGFLTGSA
jgi:tail assembly chaperone E/41/14-like protein